MNSTRAAEHDLRKKKIRKTISAYEEFVLTVAHDSLEQLKSVALGRFVHPGGVAALERIFAIYRAGFYPCGVRADGDPVAFDPVVLS